MGFAVICGGRHGVMEAVCRGASSAGGTSIGMLADSDASLANAYVRLTSISLLSGYAFVSERLMPDRSRATAYVPCCERSTVPTTSVQSRTTKSVASTSMRPCSSATIGRAANVVAGNASTTVRRSAAFDASPLR